MDRILKILYFLPSFVLAAILAWVFHGLGEVPFSLWLLMGMFFFSGILLSFGRIWGGIPALILPVADWLYSLSGYAGMRHVDTLPFVLLLAAFYAACGMILWKRRKKA